MISTDRLPLRLGQQPRQQDFKGLLLLALGRQGEGGIAVGKRQRQQGGKQRHDLLARAKPYGCSASSSLRSFSSGVSSLREPQQPLHMCRPQDRRHLFW